MKDRYIEIREVGVDKLSQYAEIPIAFGVKSIFEIDIPDGGLKGMLLREKEIKFPYIKDYDAYGGDERPLRWAKHFNMNNWGIFFAFRKDYHVGGAAVVFDTPGVHMLSGRKDLAVLWDIRVHPDVRRIGIGAKLFAHVVNWSKKHGCKELKIETQNVNVPACKFYKKQGCKLGEINRYGYIGQPEIEHEVMLIWYLSL